jgi:hypothetical protein
MRELRVTDVADSFVTGASVSEPLRIVVLGEAGNCGIAEEDLGC